ncbi:hypothetical protein ACM66B_003636 [Microbotryomycetes sp. NB124-2]
MVTVLVFTLLLSFWSPSAALVAAEPTDTAPYGPRSTPAVDVPRPNLMSYEVVENVIANDKARLKASKQASGHGETQRKFARRFDGSDELTDDIMRRHLVEESVDVEYEEDDEIGLDKRQTTTCVGSWANDTYISTLFYYGGIGYTVSLCPGAQIPMDNAAFFYWPNQTLTTQGNPTDDTRAQLYVRNVNISCLVYGGLDNTHYIRIQNIILDGGRPSLGQLFNVPATISIGGNSIGQVVQKVKVFEPRGWSALHVQEGSALGCSGVQILNNQIGPAGWGPGGAQFRKRQAGHVPGEWADGVSLACKNAVVTGNTILDATDGSIVIFGSPGSRIASNQIIARTRQALGGINLVDYNPFGGSYAGVTVTGNTITTETQFIKVGIAIGTLAWGTDNRTMARPSGGSVTNNVLQSGLTGYFGYGIAISGMNLTTVTGNKATKAKFGGTYTSNCFQSIAPLPPFQAFVQDKYTTPTCKVDATFTKTHNVVFPICIGPR